MLNENIMHTSEPSQLVFNQEIGQLFYAIAAADKVVRKSEYDALCKLVKESWLTLDEYKDEFGVEAAYQIEIVFDWFDYEKLEAEECFQAFSDYFKEHKNLFTEAKRELIMKTAHAIAGAFSGKNKSELIMLAKLSILFKS
jgi:hypothetical protein